MKRITCALCFFILWMNQVSHAQVWAHFKLVGLNADLVANGGVCGGVTQTVAATTTTDFDAFGGSGNGFTYYAQGFVDAQNDTGNCILYNATAPFAETGLPTNRIVTSAINPNLSFTLAPYDSPNVLLMKAGEYDTIFFEHPMHCDSLAFLGVTSNAFGDTIPIGVIIHYAGGAPQDTLTYWYVPDWLLHNAPNRAAGGYGRVRRGTATAGQFSSLNSSECNLYQKVYPANGFDSVSYVVFFGAFVDPNVPDTLVSPRARFALFAVSGIIIPSLQLPVTLSSFEGIPAADRNILSWKTEQETDHAYFEIERSTNASDFSPLHKQAPYTAGYAAVYHFEDSVELATTLFYRLKLVAKDGSFSYSKTVKIQRPANEFSTFEVEKVYPIPFAHAIHIGCRMSKPTSLSATVYNQLGIIVLTRSYHLPAGYNTLAIDQLPAMPGQTYLLKLQNDEGQVKLVRLSKQQ